VIEDIVIIISLHIMCWPRPLFLLEKPLGSLAPDIEVPPGFTGQGRQTQPMTNLGDLAIMPRGETCGCCTSRRNPLATFFIFGKDR
jgi:hypothetical protein